MKVRELFEEAGIGHPYGGSAAADVGYPFHQQSPNDTFINKLLYLRKALVLAMRAPKLSEIFINAPTVDEASNIAERVLRRLPAARTAQDADIKTVAGQYAYDYWTE